MPRDERWPIGWAVSLMSIHLVVAIALLGIAASDLAGYEYYIWTLWIVPQCCIVILATIIHIILLCSAKLNPAWALSFYLILWCAWVALASISGISWSESDYEDYDGGYYNDYYGYSNYYYDYYSALGIPKIIAELSLICVCGVSGLAIWIFCCVIVSRWRMQRKILLVRASQMLQQPITQYVQYTGPIPPVPFPGQPIDPKNGPYPTYYAMPPSDPNVVQYPQPTQSPPQHHSMTSDANMAQYSRPSQSPPQQYNQYPPPAQSPVQLPANYRESTQSPVQSEVQYPASIQSPIPIRKPVGAVESDHYPTYHNNP